MSRTPEIRFAGFTGDWERRNLGELTNILSASRVHKNEWVKNGVPFFRSSDVVSAFKGIQNDKAFISAELYEQLIKSSGKLEKGDLLITGGGSIGIPYIVPDNKPLYSKDADLIWIKNSENHESGFLYTWFTSQNFRNYVRSISHIGTIAHYTIEQVKDTPAMMPFIKEQKQIGEFFSSLDKIITLQQHKVEKLQQLKKAMLEKMFPKDGALVPEIRFSGFTGDWGRRRFGDILFTLPYKPYLAIPKQNGCYKVIQQGTNPIVGYATGIPCSDFKDVVIFGDHTLSLYKPNSPFFVATDGVRILKGINGINGNYLYVLLERYKLKNEGYKRYYSILAETECKYVADTFEQEAIGNFFVLLDKSIILQQRKVEKLQQLKKALLEKMFV